MVLEDRVVAIFGGDMVIVTRGEHKEVLGS